jgi:hypothetical protein
LSKLATAKHRFYEARRKKDKRLAQLDILEATAELAKYEFNATKLKFGLLPSDQDAERAAVLDRAEAEMGKLQMQIAAARKKNEREKDDDIERLSRVFNDEAKPTFVWQLDFAEIFHRSSRGNEALTTLLPDETRKEKKPHVGCYGFDLVLSNPPYVRQEKIKELKPFLENAYECYTGTADLYVYFFERAVKMLNDGGVLSFISSNKFFRAGYGEKLRKHLADNCSIRSIIDFGELPVFENAATFPMIFVAKKGETPKSQTVFAQIKSLNAPYPNMSALVRERGDKLPDSAIKGAKWTLADSSSADLQLKMEKSGIPLKEYVNEQLYYGVKTGFNKAFVIDAIKRAELIKADKKSAEVIKPLAVGDDIRKWQIENRERWLIVTPIGIEIKNYPAVFKHLKQWETELQKRSDQGNHWWELRPCDYYDAFEKPKIIFPDIAKESRFTFESKVLYVDTTAFVIPLKDYFLLGILNSSIVWSYLCQTAAVLGDSAKGGRLRLKRQYIKQIPIPAASAAEQAALSGLVDGILAAKRTGDAATVTALEAEIDTHVFRLYALTPAEIALVKSTTAK